MIEDFRARSRLRQRSEDSAHTNSRDRRGRLQSRMVINLMVKTADIQSTIT